ncbi:metallophosphoesterase family protein [Pseudogemmobacter bohemicus]|uniref:metallophosphoesterase family protein n=1 Tax=Pseudogemmobacter bohemicus TaxID=2250708 RepID=UPI000DD3411C|nr:metallophosphoesterase family protein [Pseudogemmobacter bohemicus]
MRIALISDIHGNREALEAVLADARARDIGRFVVLGDIVGYGPDPDWCVARVQALQAEGALVIQGNHDAAIEGSARDMNGTARAAIDWTRPRLSAARSAWLSALPLTIAEEDRFYAHASAHCPGDWIYITSERGAMASFRSCDASLTFCGHVHEPALYSCDRGGRVQAHAVKPRMPVPLLSSRRWLVVAGSVGQPRDGSPQAGWVIFDTRSRELSFRRTPYDYVLTAGKIQAAGLPEDLALRLRTGR